MNPITSAHLHLVLCHAPILTLLLGALWLLVGWWCGLREIQQAALLMFVLAGVLAAPLYLTVKPTASAVKALPEFSDRYLEHHEAAAGVALAGCVALSLAALGGILHFRGKPFASLFTLLMLLGALAVSGMLVWAGNAGGQIRHSEIRADPPAME